MDPNYYKTYRMVTAKYGMKGEMNLEANQTYKAVGEIKIRNRKYYIIQDRCGREYTFGKELFIEKGCAERKM